MKQAAKRRCSGTFVFDPRDPVFAEHFPGHPVVPGSLIVQAFLEVVREYTVDGAYRRVERFRFKRFIRPGRYAFLIEQADADRLNCILKEGRDIVATGRLLRRSGSAGEGTGSGTATSRANGLRETL